MRTVIVRDAMRIPLGKQGENNAVRVVWPEIAEKYAKLYGEGRFELVVVQRGQVYPAVVNVDGADLVWDVRAADTATAEVGSLELIYYVGDTIAKSQTWETVVVASASAAGTTEPPEDPARVWFDEIKRQIGDLGKLTTKAKENLVGAINEAAQTSSGGADWAQNDPTAKNYVKNRTHWAYSEEVTIVPEQVFKAETINGTPGAFLENFDRDLLCAMATGEFTATLHVVFDGAAYSTNIRGSDVAWVIGNLGLLGDEQDTGEPFVFAFQNRDGAAQLAIICRTAGAHTVALTATEAVKTLDRKYMPAVFLNGTTGERISLVKVYDQANADDWIDDTTNINLIPVFTDGGKLLQQLSDERSAFFTLTFKKSSSISISQGDWNTGELVDLPQNVKNYLRNVCINPHYHVSCNLYAIDSSGNTSVHTCGVAFHTGSYKSSVLYGVGTYWDEQYLVHVKLDLSKSPPEIKWKGIRD